MEQDVKIYPGGKNEEYEQGSVAWLSLRAKFPSASEFSQLITPAKLKVSASIGGYVARKLAEKWLGFPIQSFSGFGEMEQGTLKEQKARPWYAFEYGVDVATPGFCAADDDRCGCSPDGLILADKRGLEIKCPAPNTHVGYLLAGELPDDYRLQVQGSMLVTGYDSWTFLSYCPRFPAFVLDVPREADVIDALHAGLDRYWEVFNDGWAALVDLNGGKEPAPPAPGYIDPEALKAFQEYIGGGK
jgi:YqaJ-like viral recombinase domain